MRAICILAFATVAAGIALHSPSAKSILPPLGRLAKFIIIRRGNEQCAAASGLTTIGQKVRFFSPIQLKVGYNVTIIGSTISDFVVDFRENSRNIALSMNAHFGEGRKRRLVLREMINGIWKVGNESQEQRYSNPFEVGHRFHMSIIINGTGLKFYVNDKYIAYTAKSDDIPLNRVHEIDVHEGVNVEKVDIHCSKDAKCDVEEVQDEKLKFTAPVALTPGYNITIEGTPLSEFTVSLRTANQDSALLIRNQQGRDGKNDLLIEREQAGRRSSATGITYKNPFSIDQAFLLSILVTEQDYQIYINGKFIARPTHKIPLRDVKTVNVEDFVKVKSVDITCNAAPAKIVVIPKPKPVKPVVKCVTVYE